MTGPSIAAEPSAARTARTALPVLNERCVNRRWKPTVTPRPVATYMITNTMMSLQPSTLFHSCQATRARARIGRTVTVPVRKRSRVSLATGWTSSRAGAVAAIAGQVWHVGARSCLPAGSQGLMTAPGARATSRIPAHSLFTFPRCRRGRDFGLADRLRLAGPKRRIGRHAGLDVVVSADAGARVRPCGTDLPGERGRDGPARGAAADHVRRVGGAHAPPGRGAGRAGDLRGRPRRHVRLEQLPPPRALLRRAVQRARAPHPEHPPVPGRHRLHRRPRRGRGRVLRPLAAEAPVAAGG